MSEFSFAVLLGLSFGFLVCGALGYMVGYEVGYKLGLTCGREEIREKLRDYIMLRDDP